MLQIEVMEIEVINYQTADSIKPLVDRRDTKGNDTFDISVTVDSHGGDLITVT